MPLITYRKLQAELVENAKRLEELEFLNRKHAEAYTGSTLEQKDRELEDLKQKNADLLSIKMKLIRDNNDLKAAVNEYETERATLSTANRHLRSQLQSAPKEFQSELAKLQESSEYYKERVGKLQEENSRLEEEVMIARNQSNSHLFRKYPVAEQFAGPAASAKHGIAEHKQDWISPEGALALAEEVTK